MSINCALSLRAKKALAPVDTSRRQYQSRSENKRTPFGVIYEQSASETFAASQVCRDQCQMAPSLKTTALTGPHTSRYERPVWLGCRLNAAPDYAGRVQGARAPGRGYDELAPARHRAVTLHKKRDRMTGGGLPARTHQSRHRNVSRQLLETLALSFEPFT